MNFGESVLFAAIMTLMDEVKSKEASPTVETIPVKEIDIEFTYQNLDAKSKLISKADKLFALADKASNTSTENDSNLLISSLITGIVYKSVKAIKADDETKKQIYEFALKYCDVETDFTWDALHVDDHLLEGMLSQISDVTLDTIFVASSVGGGDDISTDFIRLLTELMIHLEDAVLRAFTSVDFPVRPPVITLDMLLVAMKKEMKRLEKEDPSLKQEEKPVQLERINQLRADAREALLCEDTARAGAYYRELANLNPDDWEAIFYKEFCTSYNPPERVSTIRISDNTKAIAQAMSRAMPLAKKQILIRPQLIADIGDACAWLSKLAANYFVATMNEYRASSQNSTAETRKVNQVYWVIQMLFSCGDAIEYTFMDDYELCKNLCVACWKIAFDCYENCNMNAPSNVYEYYQKIRKYEPSFRCSKPLTGSTTNSGTDGCYVATAVYGSYDCPQVWTLRRFRDFSMKKRIWGRMFIRVYYAFSPTIVKWFGKNKWFNSGCRKILDRFVNKLNLGGYENTPYKD